MKIVVAIIAICVGIGTLAGYLVGKHLMVSPILEAIISHVEVVPKEDGKVLLNFNCNGAILASYDVDEKKLVSPALSTKEILALGREGRLSKESDYQRIYDRILGFVTGGGAVRIAKPVWSIIKERENDKYTIPGLLGGLSGFFLGYSIATVQVPSCNSAVVVLMAQQADMWDPLARTVASRYLLQEMALFNVSESKVSEVSERMNHNQIDSHTFAIMESVEKYTPPQEEKTSWFSVEMIIEVYFPCLILCLLAWAAAVLFIRRSARLERAREDRATRKRLRDAEGKAEGGPAG